MAGELRYNQVSVPTTPASGKDSTFFSTDTPERFKRVDSGGVVYPILEQFYISQTAAYTPTATATTPFAAFNNSTNGAITLPAATSFLFKGQIYLTNTGTTSHTWGVLFGGSATLTSIAYKAMSVSATSNALTAPSWIYATTAGLLVVTAASTSATENVIIDIEGIVRINAGGTLIPQLEASATPGGTQTILTNSFFKLSPVSSNTVGNMGPWS